MNLADAGFPNSCLESVARLTDVAWVAAYESGAEKPRHHIGLSIHALESLDCHSEIEQVDLDQIDEQLETAASEATSSDITVPVRNARQLLEFVRWIATDGGQFDGSTDEDVRDAVRAADSEVSER